MSRFLKPDVILGLAVVAFALVLLLLWIPRDIEGDIINIVRRRSSIGDPMAPTITGFLLLFSGIMLTVTAVFKPRGKEGVSLRNVVFVVLYGLFMTLIVLLMLYAGPVVVALTGAADEYRVLRGTLPWKYTGFLLGGFVLIFGIITAIERKLSLRGVVLAVLVPLFIALVYDIPFDDTLLPPNGDY